MSSKHEIELAHQCIKEFIVCTPSVYSPYLSQRIGGRVFLKLDSLQKTGSFKERGALNFLLSNHKKNELGHVVTVSSGNHAQAVALHAARLGIRATIFMPLSTPNTKVRETERLKADVRLVGQNYDEAYGRALEFAREADARYIPAYNDREIISGQGTVALEIWQQVDDIDAVIVPVGGGGLIAGILQYAFGEKYHRAVEVIGVRAYDYHPSESSLGDPDACASGGSKTIADGIAVKSIGDLPLEICTRFNPTMISVTDEQIEEAIALLLERQKIIAEGAGACPVAGLLMEGVRERMRHKTVVLIISGGNIDISLIGRIAARGLIASNRLCRISITIEDIPGSLARLLTVLTKTSGNIIDIKHERSFAHLRWNEVLVDLTVLLKDESHQQLVLSELKRHGYGINAHGLEILN